MTALRAPLALVLLLPLLLACPSQRRPPELQAGEEVAAVYRARIDRGATDRRFRMWLYAAEPDRLHAEVLNPLGRTELIVDAGGGRLAIAFVAERLAFVGEATPDGMRQAIGVPLEPAVLVAALLRGVDPSGHGVSFQREGPAPGLPARFVLEAGEIRLEAALKRSLRVRASGERLGRGDVEGEFARHPLSALEQAWYEPGPSP